MRPDPHDDLTPPQLTPGARRILETAAELFYSHGIHAVGVDTIAEESGLTKRTLYDRFGSKDALVAAYLQVRHEVWWARLEKRLAALSAESTPGSRALAVFDSYTLDSDSTDRGCAFVNVSAELPPEHPGRGVIRAHKRAVEALLADILAGSSDSRSLAEHVFLLLEAGIVHRGIDGDDRRLVRARRLVEDLVTP
ncbi:TetR/AcrR family transcriptional regulator [Brevibacterium sp. LS14]|uniref:Transcriptional regulator n=1 Tax=Brevibacterium casei S18 TaxID=1229781 RepID=K9AD69_9MICO|nr:TetR/AcrR family transcriptional regulator [Brevibacterium casei]EKU45264.1 transcriptional regulator [Brevibacterium casei S18]NJE65587.1 TetR/AcrR family transcriptional regulator [Brevibacterium sp. LS14]